MLLKDGIISNLYTYLKQTHNNLMKIAVLINNYQEIHNLSSKRLFHLKLEERIFNLTAL